MKHSLTLQELANAHVNDLASYHPERNCKGDLAFRSWFLYGHWKRECFISGDSYTYSIMRNRPREIAGDNAEEFEFVRMGCTEAKNCRIPEDVIRKFKLNILKIIVKNETFL